MKKKKKKSKRFVEAPFPHFRYYKKSKHPALILGETKEDKNRYLFRKVSHSSNVARKRGYEVVTPNPDPSDPNPMIIERRKRVDSKDNFERVPKPWVYRKK